MRLFFALPVCLLLPVSLLAQARPRTAVTGTRTAQPVSAPRSTVAPSMISVGGPDWRFADPIATMIGGIDLESLAQSKIVRGAVAQLLANVPGSQSALDNFSIASGVRRALFSLRDGAAEPSVLVLLSGQLDEKDLARALDGKLQVRRVDLENVLVGTGPELEAAVARMGRPAVASVVPAVYESKTLVDGHDIWIAGRIPRMPQTASVASAIHGFALGLSLRKDLRLDASVDTANVQMAQEIVEKARASQKEIPEGTSLDVTAQGNVVQMRFAMDGEKLSEALTKAMPTPGFSEMFSSLGLSPAAQKGTASQKPVAPAPARKSAVIYGLEDGPREVPMNRR